MSLDELDRPGIPIPGALGSGTTAQGTLPFRVESVELDGAGSVAVIRLAPSGGHAAPNWTPGAHVDVVIASGLERQFSLCGDPASGESWRLAILREAPSRGGSEYMHRVRPGDTLQLRPPKNHFPLVESDDYLFIAGGIGITPILPMIARLHAAGRNWRLVYAGRSMASMAFLGELERYGDRVTVWPRDERDRLDVAGVIAGITDDTAVYCCGPTALLDAAESAMADKPDQFHVEHFSPRRELLDQKRTAFEVYLDYTEQTVQVSENQTIVEALELVGVNVPTSCREGTCGTCETFVLEGIPDHRDSYLSAAEKASNEMMMVCCSRSRTPRLVLDL